MKKNKFNLGKLFYNNHFVLMFSIIISVIIWILISTTGSGTEMSITISEIPITVTLSDNAKSDNMRVFPLDTKTASVYVTGNSVILSKVTKDNIQVTASQAGEIQNTGEYELSLTAKKQGIYSDYQILQDSLSPQKIKVLVDRYKEIQIPISDNIKYRTDPQYFASTTSFSPERITISGPESIVSKIAMVKAEYNITGTLSASKNTTTPLMFYDSDDNIISENDLGLLTISNREVQANITVLKKASLPISVSFLNAPANFVPSERVTLSPSSINIAAPIDSINNLTQINLNPINFSQVNVNNNTFELPIELPVGYKNLSNAYSSVVTINMDNISNTLVNVNNFQFTNIPNGKTAEVLTNSLTVELNGPNDILGTISQQNITAIIDLKDKEAFTGHTEVPVTFLLSGADGCWIYGNYSASILVSENK